MIKNNRRLKIFLKRKSGYLSFYNGLSITKAICNIDAIKPQMYFLYPDS